MRRLIAAAVAAALSFAASAEARTVNFADLMSATGGLSGGAVDLGGARLELVPPSLPEILSRAELRDARLLRCSGPRDQFCAAGPPPSRTAAQTMLTIFLNEGISLSNLSFDDNFAGEAPDASRSIIVNGIAYSLGELSKLTLTGTVVTINLDAAAALQLSLRSFDLSSLDAPIPAAGLLMLGGLGGLGFAMQRRKKN